MPKEIIPHTESPQEYTSLAQLALHKERLKNAIEKDEKQMKHLWNTLFKQPSFAPKTPAQKLSSIISIGGGVIDGALLGWKLYKRFKR